MSEKKSVHLTQVLRGRGYVSPFHSIGSVGKCSSMRCFTSVSRKHNSLYYFLIVSPSPLLTHMKVYIHPKSTCIQISLMQR